MKKVGALWLPGEDEPIPPRQGPCPNSGHTGSGTLVPDARRMRPDGWKETRCGLCDEILKEEPPKRAEDQTYLQNLAHSFAVSWDREGAAEDQPEGARRIWMSDTLAKQIADRLQAIAERMA